MTGKNPDQRRFRTYNRLRMALHRLKVASPGVVATLLLEAFVLGNGAIYSSNVVIKSICPPNQFKAWRDYMVELGVLLHIGKDHDNWAKYAPGPEIVEIINEEIAAKRKVLHTGDYEELDRKINRLAEYVIGKYDPPVTPEKVEALLSGAEANEVF